MIRSLIPPLILPDVQAHLADIAASAPEVIVFTSPAGKLLRHPNFRRGVWLPALAATGLTGVHFHDLRHAGNHMVASAGASLRELMDHMGHSSPRAALIYHGFVVAPLLKTCGSCVPKDLWLMVRLRRSVPGAGE